MIPIKPEVPAGSRLLVFGRQQADYIPLPAAIDDAGTAKTSWDCANRIRCIELQGVRTGATYASVFAAKLLVHRARPCAPDCGSDNPNYSFFSGHTAVAFSTLGGPRLSIALPFAIGAGGLRVAAGKHWVSDTIVGAGVGLLTSRIR